MRYRLADTLYQNLTKTHILLNKRRQHYNLDMLIMDESLNDSAQKLAEKMYHSGMKEFEYIIKGDTTYAVAHAFIGERIYFSYLDKEELNNLLLKPEYKK